MPANAFPKPVKQLELQYRKRKWALKTLSSSVLFFYPSSQVTPCVSMSFPIYFHFKNTEENSQLSPITENCYLYLNTSSERAEVGSSKLVELFPKEATEATSSSSPPTLVPRGLRGAMLGPRMPASPAELLRISPRSDAGIGSHSAVRSAQTQDSLCFFFESIYLLFPT